MKKKKNLENSSEDDAYSDNKEQPKNNSSNSIFLTTSSSSFRSTLPERKGVYQTPVPDEEQFHIQYSNRPNKKNPNKDIIYDDSLLRTPETKSFLNNQFCIQNRKSLFQNPDFSIYQEEDLNILLCHLREYSIYSAIHREYSEAKKSDALFDQIQAELVKRNVPSNEKEIELEASFEQQKKKEIAKLDLELLQFDEETKEKRIQFQQRQILDFNVFETIWREEKPPKYRKPSSRLLYLLASEKRLARIGQYDEAETYKSESNKLIEFERNQAQTLLNRDYKTAKIKFNQKQEEELRIFNQSRQEQRDLIIAKRALIEETISKRELIVLDRISQMPKTKNSDDGTIVENQNFVGNAWLKYGTGGNIAKAMYDDHITFDNPIPPLLPPNDENDLKIRKRNESLNFQKPSPRLNSVGSNKKSDKKESNKTNNSKHSLLQPPKVANTPSPPSSKSSLINKKNLNSKRLSSVSRSNSISSRNSKSTGKKEIDSSSSQGSKKILNTALRPNKQSNFSISKKDPNLKSLSSNSVKSNKKDLSSKFSSDFSSKSKENDNIRKTNFKSSSSKQKENDSFGDHKSGSISSNSFVNRKSDSIKKASPSNATASSVISAASDEFVDNNLN